MARTSIIYLILAIISVAIAFLPVYITFIGSFVSMGDLFTPVLIKHFLPSSLTLKNYVQLFYNTPYLRWLFNSTFIAVVYTILGLFLCSLAGYAFAVYNFKGKEVLFSILIFSVAIPEFVTIVPNFIIFSRLGLVNNYLSVILPFVAHPFGIFIARQYMQQIPVEILHSARIDGCPEFKIYYKIMLPLCRPALAALGVFLFIHAWNLYLYPLVLLQDPEMFTVQLGLAMLGTVLEYPQETVEYTGVLGGVTIAVIPIMIMFALMQREFIAGLTGRAVKG
jgi:ABC-type glycerol-3-phosphate transport system permease component